MRDTRISDFKLKNAIKEDAAIVHHFIKQLAIYEEMEDQLTGSVDDLEKNVWDKNQAEVLLAYFKGEAVGFCLFFTSFSTFLCQGGIYLEDVFIEKEHRNKGFGKEIFYQLASIAKERNYERVEWVCLDWNEPSIRFYEDVIGAKAQKEWIRFRLDAQGIDDLVVKK